MQLSLLLPILTAIAFAANNTFESKCHDIANTFRGVKFTQFLPAGANIDHKAEQLNETCASSSAPPMTADLCRIALQIVTSPSSSVIVEAWLPEKWEGRFLATGNSGTGGCLDYPQMAYGTSLGFATVGTNNGHNGTSAGAFLNQPEVLTDFSWRAMYAGALVGKSLIKIIYDDRDFKSYHIGCSTGGRQGWRAAQSHPELFDGIVAGAPVINNDVLVPWYGYAIETSLGANTSDTYLDDRAWSLVRDEVLKQCDALDGATDGILEDTRACNLETANLYCWNEQTEGCLSTPQVFAMQQLFSPYMWGNQYLHPGAAHGAEIALSDVLASSLPLTFLTEWFHYIFTGNLTWTPKDFQAISGLKSRDANPGDLHTFNPDLSAFRDRGGKIIHWHGQSDPYVSVLNSDWYYDLALNKTVGGDVAELDKFYRYFRISGTYHCAGGPGANAIGQDSRASAKPEENVLMALVDWVEKGEAPDTLRGYKYKDDDPKKGMDFSRKHCKHPLVNKYTGKQSDGKDEAGWQCVSK